MRLCLVISLVSIISACSNGSSNSNSSDSSIISAADLYYDEQVVQSRSLYTGFSTSQELQPDTAVDVFSTFNIGLFPEAELVGLEPSANAYWVGAPLTAFSNLPNFSFAFSYDPPTTSRTGEIMCESSGTMLVVGGQLVNGSIKQVPEQTSEGDYHYSINFENCRATEEGVSYNGSVELYYSIEPIDNPDRDLITSVEGSNSLDYDYRYTNVVIGYSNASLEFGNRSIKATGILRWPHPDSCGYQGYQSTTLYVEDPSSGKELLLDNMSMGWKDFVGGGYCTRDQEKMTYFQGELLHSEYGQVAVMTNEELYPESYNYPTWSTGHPDEYSAAPFAELVINSANTTATLQDEQLTDIGLTQELSSRKLRYWMTDSEGHRTLAIDISASQFLKGGLTDLNDSDGDGIANSWELAAGLDPNNAIDAELDLDNDGASNLFEFLHAGDPVLNLNTGYTQDLGFTDRSRARLGTNYYEDSIRLTLFTDPYHFYLSNQEKQELEGSPQSFYNDHLLISADVEGTWMIDNPKCNLVARESTNSEVDVVTCPNLREFAGAFKPNNDGLVTIKASLKQYDNDYFPENNKIEFTLDYINPGP